VLVAHGSADPRYAAAMTAVADAVRRHPRCPLPVELAYLDHLPPALADAARPGDVVVPLLLSTGYHARVDIPAAAAGCTVAPPLGPDDRLAAACADRLREAGWPGADQRPVVLAAAGSSDDDAETDVDAVAAALASELGHRVVPAYLSAREPRLGTLLSQEDVGAVVPYLLAPGAFADRVAACGAPVVAAVLGDHPAVVDVAVDRALLGAARAG
jgi:sirohydrochlorin ferrochelatase